MWHEARKQERLIRGLIVDYRRRAERRRDFYDKINADSTQILQVHGRQCKIHLEPAIAAAGDSASIMMPWQGDHSNIIDRFDVRAHLDIIPEVKNREVSTENLSQEERNCNYERYRILAQNTFLGIGEEKFLHQLAIEEQFGVTVEEKEHQKEKLHEKKGHGAMIGYNYDDSSSKVPDFKSFSSTNSTSKNEDKDDSEDESDLEILDVDLSIDVNKVEPTQAHAMNACGMQFGMLDTDLFSFLTGDAQEAERHRQLMREEKEKALFSGRKSRRQRRAHRDKLLATRVVSPPHYAARPSPVRHASQDSPSPTRSLSPPEPNSNAVTYITSFGGDDDLPSDSVFPAKTSYADKVKFEPKPYGAPPRETICKQSRRSPSPKRVRRSPYSRSRRSWSRNRSSRFRRSRSRRNSRSRRSRSRGYRSRSRNRSRSKSNDRNRYSYSDRSSRSHSRYRRSSRSNSSSSRSSSSSSSSDRRKPYNKSSNLKSNKSPENIHTPTASTNTAPIVRPPRYYGRKREGCKSSSSELSVDSSDDQSNITDKTNENLVGSKTSQVSNIVRSSGSTSKQSGGSSEKLSLKERLRRKMQAQLSRQLRADKKAEAERLEREQQMQQERDDEMREMAIKIRRRQREMRHQRRASYSSRNSDSSSPSRSSRSPAQSPPYRKRTPDRDEKKKYDDSPPRKIREKPRSWDSDKDKRFEGPQNERSSVERDRFSSYKNQEDNEKKYDSSYSRYSSSKSSFGNRSENKEYESKNSQDSKSRSKSRDEKSSYYDSKKSRSNDSGRQSRSDHNESRSVTTKTPIRRLVDY